MHSVEGMRDIYCWIYKWILTAVSGYFRFSKNSNIAGISYHLYPFEKLVGMDHDEVNGTIGCDRPI